MRYAPGSTATVQSLTVRFCGLLPSHPVPKGRGMARTQELTDFCAFGQKHSAEASECMGLEQIQDKWIPVIRPDLPQNKGLEPRSDSVRKRSALEGSRQYELTGLRHITVWLLVAQKGCPTGICNNLTAAICRSRLHFRKHIIHLGICARFFKAIWCQRRGRSRHGIVPGKLLSLAARDPAAPVEADDSQCDGTNPRSNERRFNPLGGLHDISNQCRNKHAVSRARPTQ